MEIFHKLEFRTFAVAVERMRSTHCGGTYHWNLGQDDKGNNWAIVLGWSNGFDPDETDDYADGTYRLCVKLAYQPSDSLLQCDYDIDWLMPHDETTGEIDVVEFALIPELDLKMVWDWVLDAWEERYLLNNMR